MSQHPVAAWHQLLATGNLAGLDILLAEEVVFYSPILFKPQQGKALTTMYLHAAYEVLVNDSFHYVREVIGEQDAVLEFVAIVDGIEINGVDMLRWDEQGRITEFKVMIRPMKAIELIKAKMAEMLQAL